MKKRNLSLRMHLFSILVLVLGASYVEASFCPELDLPVGADSRSAQGDSVVRETARNHKTLREIFKDIGSRPIRQETLNDLRAAAIANPSEFLVLQGPEFYGGEALPKEAMSPVAYLVGRLFRSTFSEFVGDVGLIKVKKVAADDKDSMSLETRDILAELSTRILVNRANQIATSSRVLKFADFFQRLKDPAGIADTVVPGFDGDLGKSLSLLSALFLINEAHFLDSSDLIDAIQRVGRAQTLAISSWKTRNSCRSCGALHRTLPRSEELIDFLPEVVILGSMLHRKYDEAQKQEVVEILLRQGDAPKRDKKRDLLIYFAISNGDLAWVKAVASLDPQGLKGKLEYVKYFLGTLKDRMQAISKIHRIRGDASSSTLEAKLAVQRLMKLGPILLESGFQHISEAGKIASLGSLIGIEYVFHSQNKLKEALNQMTDYREVSYSFKIGPYFQLEAPVKEFAELLLRSLSLRTQGLAGARQLAQESLDLANSIVVLDPSHAVSGMISPHELTRRRVFFQYQQLNKLADIYNMVSNWQSLRSDSSSVQHYRDLHTLILILFILPK